MKKAPKVFAAGFGVNRRRKPNRKPGPGPIVALGHFFYDPQEGVVRFENTYIARADTDERGRQLTNELNLAIDADAKLCPTCGQEV